MGLEVEVETESKSYFFVIDIDHVPNKEIALGIFEKRGKRHVDRCIVDGINYWEKIKVPIYRPFMAMDRKKSIKITNTLTGADSVLPIENLLSDFNYFSRVSTCTGAFRFDRVYNGHCNFNLYFPTLVSISHKRRTQIMESG